MRQKHLIRIDDEFVKCINGTREASNKTFGAAGFMQIKNRTFYFCMSDDQIESDLSKNENHTAEETLLGRVINVKFVLRDGLEQPCFSVIETDIGNLFPPYGGKYWHLERKNGDRKKGYAFFS